MFELRNPKNFPFYWERVVPTSRKCIKRKYASSKTNQVFFVDGREFVRDECTNVTAFILEKTCRKLHSRTNHPICIVKNSIFSFLQERRVDCLRDDFPCAVTETTNFDTLLFDKQHSARAPSDTFFVQRGWVLRTHTTCHGPQLLRDGHRFFAVAGDVFRRDRIDRSHHAAFHQLDVVRVCASRTAAMRQMRSDAEALIQRLFGERTAFRWRRGAFPFTQPSFELEVADAAGNWIEVAGCGLLQAQILQEAGVTEAAAYAAGVGLDRIAMLLTHIDDIRVLWSEDRRFLRQFSDGSLHRFVPLSAFPAVHRDISFWLPQSSSFAENDLYAVIRDFGGDLVESVERIDAYRCPVRRQNSACFRVTYRAFDRVLSGAVINEVQKRVRAAVSEQLPVELR